jgi:predicted ester cyclase
MRDTHSTLLYKWFNEVWNQDDETAIDKMMSNDSITHGILPKDHQNGAEGFKLFFKDFRKQFHNIRIEVEDVICQDDVETARTTVSAIHSESGKPVTFSGISMARVAGGKISEAWNNYDFLDLYQQVGQKLSPA